MDSGSPKREECRAEAPENARASPERQPTPVPQNTLLNLAKLSTGTPRFEMQAGATEEPRETSQKGLERDAGVGAGGEPGATREEDKENQLAAEASLGPAPAEPREEERRAPEPETGMGWANGNGEPARAQAEAPRKLVIPPDELMQIKSERAEDSPPRATAEEPREAEAREPSPEKMARLGDFRIREEIQRPGPQSESESEGKEAVIPVMQPLRQEPSPEKAPAKVPIVEERAGEPLPERGAAIVEEAPAEEVEIAPQAAEERPPQQSASIVPVEPRVAGEGEDSGEKIVEETRQLDQESEAEASREEVRSPAPQEEPAQDEASQREATPEPEQTLEAVAVPGPEPEASPEPVREAEPILVPETTPQPAPENTAQPITQPVSKVTFEPTPLRAHEPAYEALPEPTPAPMPAAEPELPSEPVSVVEPEPIEIPARVTLPDTECRLEQVAPPELAPAPEEPPAQPMGVTKESLAEPIVSEKASPKPSPAKEPEAPAGEAKLDIEVEAQSNPILVRNAAISEDEAEAEFETSGDNRVFAWGSAECDQYECPNYESRRPVEIEYFAANKVKVAKLTCGSQHSLLLDSRGRVYSWGNSDDGVLGRSASSASSDSTPGLVELDRQMDMISAGDSHSVFANSQTGDLFFCGVIKSTNGRLSRMIDFPESVSINKFKKSGIKSVLSGAHHVLIHSRYNVYAFGDNSCGALGYILRTYDERTDCLTPHALRLKGIARIFTGAYHCFAITNKGILKTWGLNSSGQLGLPYYLDNPEDSDINHEDPNRNANVLQLPHVVGGIEGRKVVDIVGGEHHTLLLMSNGDLWGTGRNDDGQLGGLVKPPRDSYEEVRVPNSRVRVAGTNNYINVTVDYMPNKFMRVPVDKDFQRVMASAHFNYAVNTAEAEWPKFYSWGTGFNYVLGNGKEETVSTPFRVSNKKLFKGLVPTDLALGNNHVVYYTGDTHPVVLDEVRLRNNRKRDRSTAIQKGRGRKNKRVKTK